MSLFEKNGSQQETEKISMQADSSNVWTSSIKFKTAYQYSALNVRGSSISSTFDSMRLNAAT